MANTPDSENHRNRPGEDRSGWGSYEVAAYAVEACFWDGIETKAEALEVAPCL